ncbi:MAG: MucB/RseB C-terminal domain-containing protein [Gammaproteobacteria bacterium]|nr:MucB/RseB C-terminal domain-containing protein [Gammaproteobacteria bacterium]MDH3561338.1 MucB/RseB C-terminal domain-containing protein [Gammaproteobacteria bacterium]
MTAGNKGVWWPVLLLLAVAGQASAQDQAREWLGDMSRALQTLNYDGTFVYLHDGKLEAMRIIHQLGSTGEKERLVSLTGSAREVLRDDESVTCIMPDSKSVMVGQSRPRQLLPMVPQDLDSLLRYYRFEMLGEDRISGFQARTVAITPRDEYRYGYRFWIDTDSKLLLKSDLTAVDGTAIEQVMFTRLDIGSTISDAALQPSLTGKGYVWYHQSAEEATAPPQIGETRWSVGRLPDGFSMTHYQRKRLQPEGQDTEHMVFSDGLATVSVYVESLSSDNAEFIGLSGMGAMNAFGAMVDGHQVTVVGEVPALTVEMMARSVASRQVSAHD